MIFRVLAVITFTLSLMARVSYGVDWSYDLKAVAGTDSNPLQLADSRTIIEDQFWLLDAKTSVELFDRLEIAAGTELSQYLDDERANADQSELTLRFKDKFKLFKHRIYYRLGAERRQHDETYVSRRTGQVATFAGESIADRYDYELQEYYGQIRYKTRQATQLALRISKRDKSYETFQIVGLSNLDYSQTKTNFEVKYDASESGRFLWNTWIAERPFKDKRAKDIDGNDIPDSDLRYRLYGTRLSYVYKPDASIRWQYNFLFENRRDNESGYWDAERAYLSISARYRLADFHTLRMRFRLQKFSYDARVEPVDTDFDEANREHKGAIVSLGYQWDLYSLFSTQFAFYTEIEGRVFDSTDPDYQYDQNKLSAGIRWSL